MLGVALDVAAGLASELNSLASDPLMRSTGTGPAWGALTRTALGLCYRSGLNAARISVANISGSSQAAKWPPRPASWK